MLNLLASLFGAIVPSLDADPEVQYMWRLKIAGLVCVLILGVPVIVLAATGKIWGFDGFLPKADFEFYLKEAHKLREERLRVDLLNLQASRCKAPTEEARQLYTREIDALEIEYEVLTGRQHHSIDCRFL